MRQILFCCVLAAAWIACTSPRVPGASIISETLAHRTEVDSAFRLDPNSPFLQDTTIQYHGLNWFPPDTTFYFLSQLHRFANPMKLIVYGTKGEERPMVKYGYFLLSYGGKDYPLNVYKSDPPESDQLSVWFTDETTGKETYNVGRYVDVGEEVRDPGHLYALNLNNSYNPYCAYSSRYTCAVPPKEDHLPFAVRAGEKKYHQ